ncbi:MAG: hypothetical protein ISR69_07435 [Gammaproteobacteria bacterium]|nr:hypothetical protein [Gammaproteobacteria bacterium]
MIEYIFFHKTPYTLFCEFLNSINIPFKEGSEETDIEGLLIHIADDLDDAISEKIEDYYDELLEMDGGLVEEDPAGVIDQAGLAVTLNNGDSTLASVNPDVLNRMLTVVTRDEVGEFIDAIVNAVEKPDKRPICKR